MSLERTLSNFKKNAKRFAVGTITGLTLLTSALNPAYAVPVGGAETVGKGKFGIGVEGQYTSGRDMKEKTGQWGEDIDGLSFMGQTKITPEITQMDREMVKISYGLLDCVDIYTKLGTAGLEAKANASGTLDWTDGEDSGKAALNGVADYKADNAFAYGAGIKAVHDAPKWLAGIDAQYIKHKNDYNASASITYTDIPSGESITGTTSWKGDITVQEIQAAAFGAAKLGKLTPYAGVKYSNFSLEDSDESGESEKYKGDKNIGVFVGTNIKPSKNFTLNIEGGFIDEESISVSGNLRF